MLGQVRLIKGYFNNHRSSIKPGSEPDPKTTQTTFYKV